VSSRSSEGPEPSRGATGGGHEFSAAAGPTPVIFNGTISF
jgi:hypothetical protein